MGGGGGGGGGGGSMHGKVCFVWKYGQNTLSNIAQPPVSVPLNSRNSECTSRVELNDIQLVLFEIGLVPLSLKKLK